AFAAIHPTPHQTCCAITNFVRTPAPCRSSSCTKPSPDGSQVWFCWFVTAGRTVLLIDAHISQRHGTRCERDLDENMCRFSQRHYNAPMSLVVSTEFAAGLTASVQFPGGSPLRPDAIT